MITAPKLSPASFAVIREIVRQCWYSVASQKMNLVEMRLSARLRQLGFTSFEPYCQRLRSEDGRDEMLLLDAISTNVTSFFVSDLASMNWQKPMPRVWPRVFLSLLVGGQFNR